MWASSCVGAEYSQESCLLESILDILYSPPSTCSLHLLPLLPAGDVWLESVDEGLWPDLVTCCCVSLDKLLNPSLSRRGGFGMPLGCWVSCKAGVIVRSVFLR